MRRAALVVGLLLASTAAAQPRKPGKGFQPPKASPALTVYPTVNNGLPAIGANECPTGVSLLGSRGEAVTFTAAGAGRHCTRTDGGLVALAANEPAVSGASLKVRAGVENKVFPSETLVGWTAAAVNLSDAGVVAAPTIGAVGSCPYPDPRGGNSAVKVDFPAISDTGRAGVSVIYKSFTATAVPWNGSVYTRAADATDGGTVYLEWTPSSLTVTAADAGANWGRYSNTETLTAASRSLFIGPDTRNPLQPATQPALSVCVWGAQAALGSTAVDYCGPTTTGAVTCALESTTVANQLAAAPANPTQWCVGNTVTPGAAFASLASGQGIANIGATAAANDSASLSFQTTTGKPLFIVYDAAAGTKQVLVDSAVTAAKHSVYGCSDNGTLSIWVDGYKPAQTVSGAGTGIITTQPATVTIAILGAANPLQGSWSDFRMIRGVSP